MTDLLELVRDVKGPRPVVSREQLERLTERQRQLLEELSGVFAQGFTHLTMAEIAAQLSCSLRTLYALAPSRDDLVLMVVDSALWEVGRSAVAAIEPDMAPLDAIRAYLHAAHHAVADTTEPFATDADADPATRAVRRAHARYLVDVTRALLDHAVERGDIDDIDTAAVARVVATVAADFATPEMLPTLRTGPREAADAVVDIVLRGLAP